jgi:hypothetical protein
MGGRAGLAHAGGNGWFDGGGVALANGSPGFNGGGAVSDAARPEYAQFCEFCGGEQPCRRQSCLDALMALAAYWDEVANPIKPEGSPL